MKFTMRKGDTSTIRKVWSDDKEVLYGVVGTVEDLMKADILTYCDFPPIAWLFLPDLGIMKKPHFGNTREEAIEELI